MAVAGMKKAAMLIGSLDIDTCALLFKHLGEQDVTLLGHEMTSLGDDVDADTMEAIREEFLVSMRAPGTSFQNASALLCDSLKEALGASRAEKILDRIKDMAMLRDLSQDDVVPFEALLRLGPQDLASLVAGESAQTVSLIFSHLPSKVVGNALTHLPEELRGDVITRIATAPKSVSVDVLHKVDAMMREKIGTASDRITIEEERRLKTAAEILNWTDMGSRNTVLDGIRTTDPDLANELVNHMFVFEDLVDVPDQGLQVLFMSVDSNTTALALKNASPALKERVMANLPKRARETIEEILETMPRRRLSDVQAVQREIIETMRRLEEKGQVAIMGHGEGAEILV